VELNPNASPAEHCDLPVEGAGTRSGVGVAVGSLWPVADSVAGLRARAHPGREGVVGDETRPGESARPHRHRVRKGRQEKAHRGGKTGKGNPYLKGVLGEAAAAAAKTNTTFTDAVSAFHAAAEGKQGQAE
jgi:hypothetical protein